MAEEKLVTGPGRNGRPVTLPVGSCCNILQYHLLKRCSEREDTALWNRYRERYPEQEIELVGADLGYAKLPYAERQGANLQHAQLWEARLPHAFFGEADLQYTELGYSNLQQAMFWRATLQHANLKGANLQETRFFESYLEGVRIYSCVIRDAWFSYNTLDTQTDFTGSNIHEAIMSPQLEAQLQCNMRRIHWRKETAWKKTAWNKRGVGKRGGEQIKWWERITWTFLWVCAVIWQCISGLFFCKPTRLFWSASAYGTSSKRLMGVFFSLAVGFAVLYC
jgi:hypothetical protein